MRTIKDPKKTPEVRRRIDVEEDDASSTKSTPPKKRRTAKAKKDDSLNDSGSTIDAHSDGLSDKSFVGSDSVSDTSSLKSTPPKKRGYNKVVKSLELNGEIDDHNDVEDEHKKVRPKRAIKKVKESLSDNIDEADTKHENSKLPPNFGPAESPKLLKRAAQKAANDKILGKKKDLEEKQTPSKEKKRKLSPRRQGKNETDKLDKGKKPPVRKRKIEIDEVENIVKDGQKSQKKGPVKKTSVEDDNITEVPSPPKQKKQKKTKKQMEKELAEELKRQTEEQRNNHDKFKAAEQHSECTETETAIDSRKHPHTENMSTEEYKSVLNDNVEASEIDLSVNKQTKEKLHDKVDSENSHCKEAISKLTKDLDAEDIPGKENNETLNSADCLNQANVESYVKDDDVDEDSELDTSFESISSGYRPPDETDHDVENKENNNESAISQHSVDESKGISPEHAETKVEIKCEFCGNISKSKGGHTRHLRKCQPQQFELEIDNAHKAHKVFMCENCDYSAPRRVLVITHMKSHGIFQCKRCKFRTTSEEGLDEHTIAEHKDRSDCKFCKLCNRYVKCNEIPLEKHMEDCQGRVPFKCPECDKEFQYESSLKCHVVSHYPDKPKLFSCDQCDYKSNYKANLKKHIRHIHEQKKERDIKCLECDKMFYTEENMRRHLKLHSDERPYKCEEQDCEKAFKTQNGLKFHMLSHTTEKPFSCTLCSKEFKTERCLLQHIREVHDGAPKSYKCHYEGCGFAFYKKTGLDRHLAYHTDNRSFFCSYDGCPKAFRTVDALKIHTLQHTNENPVSCQHCSFVCKQKSSLRFHMMKKHPEIVQSNLEAKQKLNAAACKKSSQLSENSTMPIQMKLENVSDMLNIENSQENEQVKTADSFTSVLSSPNHHPEEKSISIETSEPVATSDTLVPLKQPVSEAIGEDTAKTEMPSTKEPEVGTEVDTEVKPSEADLYEFQSEDEDGHKMQPGLLRKEFDKDKPPLPPVSTPVSNNLIVEPDLSSSEPKPLDKPVKPVNTVETPKVRKKPGPKPKPKPEKTEEELKPKKRGRKKKSETEKKDENEVANEEKKTSEVKKVKSRKHSGSPKGRKEKSSKDSETESESPPKPEKKKRGRKPKEKVVDENKEEPVKKKRGRKKKVKEEVVEETKKETPEVDTGEQDATINYSEVEGGELLTDSKDGVSDINTDSIDATRNQGAPLINLKDSLKSDIEEETVTAELETVKDEEVDKVDKVDDNLPMEENENVDVNKDISKEESDVESDGFSSDLGSDFEEDLKPPPAPRPPPINDSEDGDIESGPENEDFNNSVLSNEPLRDFESSREISREISRDFESSRDDSVKNPSAVNSVETSTPKDDGQPLSVKMESVRSVEEHGTPLGQDIGTPHHSHQGSVPHTPSHSSIPPTPGNLEYESHSIENRVDDRIKGQNNDENTDESSMPEVDKDYVGRFFEEIQSVPSQSVEEITRMNSIEENSKTKEIQDMAQSDSGVPSSMTSTESNMQMQSPPADLSLKRMEILSSDRHSEDQYQPRAESVTRSADRIPSVYDSQYPNPLDPYASPLSRDSVLRQTDSVKVPSPNPASFMRFPESELQRQKLSTPYDRNIQNLQRITDSALPAPAHTSSSPLLRHDMFPTGSGVAGSMSRNPFQSSWTGQEVRPPHWGHPTYLQRPLDQHTASASSSLFGKDSYLASREFMFDPTRVAAERNMFSSLASSQRPDIPHDTFQFDRFDLGSYLSSHGYNTSPSLPVDYTRATHNSTQKSLDERYRQSSSGVSEFRGLPPTSSSDVFGVNSSFNLEKYGYTRDPLYHSQHLSDNPNTPLFPHGVPSQHSMFGRDYPHRSFYTQNSPYGFMNDKNYAAASAKLGHTSTGVPQQRELVPVPRPNMSAPESQLQDPYRHHSSMLYNMMNRYFE